MRRATRASSACSTSMLAHLSWRSGPEARQPQGAAGAQAEKGRLNRLQENDWSRMQTLMWRRAVPFHYMAAL